MIAAKCAKCGTIREFERLPKKFCCSECGILNTPQPETAGSGEQACGCLLPERPEWRLPSGEIDSPDGTHIYTTADDATGLTREEWIQTFGYDPEIVLKTMRQLGKEGKEGYVNTSTLGHRGACQMKHTLVMMLLASLVAMAAAQTPADLIQPRTEPVQAMSLSGTDPASARAIDGLNGNLTAWQPINIPDLGKLFSDSRRSVKQENGPTVPDELINFTESEGSIPASIDAVPGNEGQDPQDTAEGGLVFY